MNIFTAKSCDRLGNILEKALQLNPVAARGLDGAEISIGPARESRFGVPPHAQDAIFVGDAKWLADKVIDAATEAMFKRDPSKVAARFRYDRDRQKWSMNMSLAGDAPDFIGGQLFSPWNISYMAKVFKEPLSYSNVSKYVHYDSGSNPWAEIYTLFLEQYSGWAMAAQTGSLQNIMASDVNVQDGMMSAPVINLMGTYSLTLEEQVRGDAGSPFGQSAMTRKQSYLNYAFEMLKAVIAIYGNDETDTDGILNVNPIRVWPAGDSLKDIWAGTSVSKGNLAYMLLAERINDYITLSDGKFKSFKIVMSPEALSLLRSMPYSDVYDPTSAMKIFLKNYGAQDKEGSVPSIEFISEPLLKAGSIFNPSDADYTIITSPDIEAGPTEETQPTYVFGAPLQKFIFPAIPGQYNTQYKTLARVAGIIAPVPAAIQVYQGLGVQ